MPKAKVIEITGAKLDPHADYIFVVNMLTLPVTEPSEQLGMLGLLEKNLSEVTKKNVIVLPVLGKPNNAVKVFQMAKEITVNQEVRLKNGKSS